MVSPEHLSQTVPGAYPRDAAGSAPALEDALQELVRLLARQAARDWQAEPPKEDVHDLP